MNYLANFLTVLSLSCGFVSIIFSLENHFTLASWAIILSVFFDGLDGQIARRNPIPSEFGKELDSLVDVVSFGIAPSLLGYIFIYHEFHLWATIVLFLYLFCSIFRLAKYNITAKEKMVDYFFGLPTTVSGGTLSSFILIFRKSKFETLPKPVPVIFLFLVLLLTFLMISRVRYLNLDGLKQIFGRYTFRIYLWVSVVLIVAIFLQKPGTLLFILFSFYVLFSPTLVRKID